MHHYNNYIYARPRRRFGRQCLFTDRTKMMLSITSSHRLRLAYILRNPVHRSTQLSPTQAASWMETENVTYAIHGVNHYEGGWPDNININDEEQTLRHRKKIEREDSWGIQVNALIKSSMDKAAQNSAVNIYEDFFEDLPPELGEDIKMPYEARQVNIFHDPVQPQRKVTVIDWSPNDARRFIAQHTYREVPLEMIKKSDETEIVGGVNSFYIWDLENPIKPLTVFESPEVVRRALYCPRDENYVAGGLQSGKIAIWDTRTGQLPIKISPLEKAHREAAVALCWVHSKTNSEFYTGSYDGSVKYWDARYFDNYLQEILLDPDLTDDQSRKKSHGVCVLEFEYTIPVRFIIGSDQGHIFIGNRKGITPSEALLANYKLFMGPIRTIERNPFFVKNFLICGDWCAKIWAEECKGSPTTLLVKKKHQILCGTWSTSRCSLFVTGDMAGELDFWDLLLHQRKPIYTIKFRIPIKYVKFRGDGEFLTVALDNGDTHILELDEAIKRSGHRDKALIASMFEREQLRCKLLEGRVEELKLRHKTSLMEAQNKALEVKDMTIEDEYVLDAAKYYEEAVSDTELTSHRENFMDLVQKIDKKRQEREHVMERTDFEYDYYAQAEGDGETRIADQQTGRRL